MRRIGDLTFDCSIGFGAMHLSGAGSPSESTAMTILDAAHGAGIRLFDTADAYCTNASDTGHNERLLGRWLRLRRPAGAIIATKGGHIRDEAGAWKVDGRPEHLVRACDASLLALGVDIIDLYHFHRPDPTVPYAESLGALARLREAGKVQRVGVSNACVRQIAEAAAICSIVSVQNELSPDFRSSLPEVEICESRGLAFLAWGPLGGARRAARLGGRFAEVAAAHRVSPQQVALAWELALSPCVMPIPGASRGQNVIDSAAATLLELTSDEVAHLSGA